MTNHKIYVAHIAGETHASLLAAFVAAGVEVVIDTRPRCSPDLERDSLRDVVRHAGINYESWAVLGDAEMLSSAVDAITGRLQVSPQVTCMVCLPNEHHLIGLDKLFGDRGYRVCLLPPAQDVPSTS